MCHGKETLYENSIISEIQILELYRSRAPVVVYHYNNNIILFLKMIIIFSLKLANP